MAVFPLLCTLAVATIWDAQISRLLYNPETAFAQFFERIGELPIYCIIPVIGMILFGQKHQKRKIMALLFNVSGLFLAFAGWCTVGNWLWSYFAKNIPYKWMYLCFFAAILTFISLLATHYLDAKVLNTLLYLAFFAFVVAAVSNGLVYLLKALWSRPRFMGIIFHGANTDFLSGNNDKLMGFVPWYKPNFLFHTLFTLQENAPKVFESAGKIGFGSFPSSHTTNAAFLFCVGLLPDLFPALKSKKMWYWGIPACWTALVAISRIVRGGHYLSDVTIACLIVLVIIFFFRWLLFSKLSIHKRLLAMKR